MKKYGTYIFYRQNIQKAMKITLWEKLFLLFIKTKEIRTEESITHYKFLNGKIYIKLLDVQKEAPSRFESCHQPIITRR